MILETGINVDVRNTRVGHQAALACADFGGGRRVEERIEHVVYVTQDCRVAVEEEDDIIPEKHVSNPG